MTLDSTYLLGFTNVANSEAAAAMLQIPKDGGEIKYICIDEERLSRQKHSYSFPLRAIDYCLEGFGLESLHQVDHIFTDHGSFRRFLVSTPSYRRIEHDYLKLKLDFPRERIHIVDHHDAHAASAFYPSGFDEAAVLVVDGFGSGLNTQSLYHMRGLEMTEIERGHDWGIGALYALITRGVLPYGPEKGFGKVMGLAPYGRDMPGPVLEFNPRDVGLTTDYSGFFSRLPIARLQTDIRQCQDREAVLEPYFARAAYDVQKECERQIVRMAAYAYEKTGCDAICLAGGTMLNGIANAQILEQTPINRIWIQPAASDTGGPFGMVLNGYYQVLAKQLPKSSVATVRMPHAYTGRSYPRNETQALLERYGIAHREAAPEEVAGLLADGKVCAWFEGGAEYGPRALGHRSINADPRSKSMWEHLNTAVKFREGYRPYAPSVLAEHAKDWLQLRTDSPFMLMVVEVKEDKRGLIEAVTHIDHTTRPQTVTAGENPNYHRMISAFYEKTGVPMVLNTSFNVNKEPIVESPADALVCALGTSIDYLYLDGLLVHAAEYRDAGLLNRILEDRRQTIDANWVKVRDRHLRDYDVAERDAYLVEENKIAEWYRDYRAKYELERAMADWRDHGKRILIVGTRLHTACLFLYIPDFPLLDVAGFVAMDDLPGETGEFGAFLETRLQDVDWTDIDSVLVSSHEYQNEAAARVSSANPDIEIVKIYDTACDSLLYVLPGRWPVMNPAAAQEKGVALTRKAARSATSIDFDFDAGEVDISERYGFAVAYRTPMPGLPGAVGPQTLDSHLQVISQSFSFATFDQLFDPEADLDESSALISFDGGYKSFVTEMLPVLTARSAPATLFVAGASVEQGEVLLFDKLAMLMERHGAAALSKALNEYSEARGTVLENPQSFGFDALIPNVNAAAQDVWKQVIAAMPPAEARKALDPLFAGSFGDEKTVAREIYLSADDLKRCIDGGVSIGLLPYRSALLSRLALADQEREIRSSAEAVNRATGGRQDGVLSVPFGTTGTWNNTTKRAAKACGLKGAVVLGERIIKPADIKGRWELPRLAPTTLFDSDGKIIGENLLGLGGRE